MQLVEIVENNVKFHLSQDKTNQFIVTTVSKTINQKEVTVEEADLAETAVVEDLVDGEPEDMAETTAVVEDLEETDLHERCTNCLLYTSPSPRDATLSRMPSSA